MIISGSVRRAGERLRMTAQLIDGATGCYIWSESVDATLGDLFPAQERVAEAIAARIEPELGERPLGRGVAQAEREPRRAQPLPAGALSPEPAHRGRPAQGARLFREVAGRRRGVRRGARRVVRRLRPARALRRVRPRRGLDQGGGQRDGGGDARRQFGGSAHLARARQVDAGLGLGRRRAGVPARDQPRPARRHRRITGTRCRAWRRSAASTRRSTR